MLVKLYILLNIVLFGQSCPRLCKCSGTSVDCSYTGITKLDILANVATNTTVLDLFGNRISIVEKNIFMNFTNLKYLSLRNNIIFTIKDGSWHGLEKLQSLDLLDNGISIIDKNTFINLTNLHSLYLQKNKISILEEDSFMTLRNLKTLNLQDNQISTIKDGSWHGLEKLESLYLGDLHNCTCNAVNEIKTLQKRNVTVFYTCPQSSINGPKNTTMVACSGDWTKWYKTAECIEQDQRTITPYRRKCENKSGEEAKGTCNGLDTKSEPCKYNKDINPVTTSTTSKVKGKITLIKMTLNGTKITNTELGSILRAKGRVYDELVEDSWKGLLLLHHQSNNNVTDVKIIRMTVGSLIIDYVITLKVHGKETLKDVKLPTLMKSTIIYPNSSIFNAQGSGLISISDYDECKEAVDDCDKNAYCVIFPDRISYACQCKDTYAGNGFECHAGESNKKDEAKDWVLITILSIVGVVFVALLMGMLIWYGKRRQRMKIAKKYMDIKGLTLFADKHE